MHVHDHAHAAQGTLLNWLPLALIVLITLAYLAAANAQRYKAAGWSGWRSVFFTLGSLLLAVAVAPPLMAWAHHDLVGHMALHLLIGMLAPLAWVLAAPITLLLSTLPQAGGRRVAALLQSRFVRFVSHPVSALILNIGGMYVLYLTPLYSASLDNQALHYWIHVHFLVAGYLFCWAILAEPDVSPHRLSLRFRLGVLFASIATHSLLGKLMYGYAWPRGTGHSLEEVQAAAQLMYYGGDLAEVLLAVVLLTLWLRRPVERREGLFKSAERDISRVRVNI
ncbi:cytochrome c oxidase assembly protein [Vreelandella populi]|uniref:Cytochrome c oxidase assembly protein n=1 Tax=Vreelandella populi TaxID=2498858 RepID=A0A3S0X2H6_9GAMM|nr:cytochrome c oxidase assembly protein [Halomonas populi]RUR35455.1 cytochrome c oxidase assembly protein [Halomonas populi]RUR47644.1 cytochrome c oxidase assembly protein [Halomonas populi]RUR54492.1 cytochrome c oxidase assembly protein [Halomonas populi]